MRTWGAGHHGALLTAQPFCFALSAKRYALFNMDAAGHLLLRKASAHGLDHLREPYGADDPAPTVPPDVLSAAHWQHDLWCRVIRR